MRVALYIRVSSIGQVRDGYSLDFQEQILRDFCQREGHTIADIYRDGGASGSNTQRKDLLRLIDDAKQKRFDLVLIFRVDRFSRDPVDLLALVRTLESNGIKLRSVTESVDASDPAGELMLTILGAIGKFVRANIIQNAMLGKTKRAETGKYTGGKVPFGYVVGPDGKYLPDHTEWAPGLTKADLIRKAFELYLESSTTPTPGTDYVVQWFTSRGIPSPDGIGWTKTTLSQMLKHPAYTGTFTYAKRSQQLGKQAHVNPEDQWVTVPDAHEPMVSQEMFEQVQELKATLRAGGRHPDQDVQGGLLTGYVACSVCGASLSYRKPNKAYTPYYTCGSRVNDTRLRRGTACKDFPFVRSDRLEEVVWTKLEEAANNQAAIEELLALLRSGAAPQLQSLNDEMATIKRRLADLENEEMTLTTAWAQKKLPQHLWEKQIERLEEDRDKALAHLRRTENEISELKAHPALAMDPEKVVLYLRRIFRGPNMTHEEKRQALAILCRRKGITVSSDGQVKIVIQFPRSEVSCSVDVVKPDVALRHS